MTVKSPPKCVIPASRIGLGTRRFAVAPNGPKESTPTSDSKDDEEDYLTAAVLIERING